MRLALPGRQLTEGTWRSAAPLSLLFACLCLLFLHLVPSARLPITLSLLQLLFGMLPKLFHSASTQHHITWLC